MSERERDYIDALAKRYTNELLTNRSHLDKAFAEAMGTVAKKYPDDIDAQVLYAEALMDTSPWNYWGEDMTPKPEAQLALTAIESVLKRAKAHSGADHLYIHLVEAGPNPEKGIPSADRIGKLTPGAGHLVHMASHIYVRVGRYHDAVVVNERAARADEDYARIARPVGMYPGGYYPHNVHFLWFANDLEGRSKNAIAAASKVGQYTTGLLCGAMEGPRQRYLPLLAYARFGRWEDILKQSAPADQYRLRSGHGALRARTRVRRDGKTRRGREGIASLQRPAREHAREVDGQPVFSRNPNPRRRRTSALRENRRCPQPDERHGVAHAQGCCCGG